MANQEKINQLVSRLIEHLEFDGWDDDFKTYLRWIQAKPKVKKEIFKKLEEAIIEFDNPKCIYNFAISIEGANISKLQDVLIQCKNVRNSGILNKYIFYFARDIAGADIAKLEKAILPKNKYGSISYIIDFAREIKGADISKFEDAIIQTDYTPYKYIYEFAYDVPNANIPKLQAALILTGNLEYICYFAQNIKGADISKLEEKVIASGNKVYIKYFMENVKGANIQKLSDALNLAKVKRRPSTFGNSADDIISQL